MEIEVMDEVWKDIEHYKGIYQVSNRGRVRSLDRQSNGRFYYGKVLTNRIRADGYVDVMLSVNRSQYRPKIHTLVAKAFIDNPNQYSEVNHKDECKSNNAVSNLEWCSRQYNNQYKGLLSRKGSTQAKRIAVINRDSKETFNSIRKAAKYLGISPNCIYSCLRKKQETTHGFKFEII